MFYLRNISIVTGGFLVNDKVIKTIHGREATTGFIIPKRGDILHVVGDDGKSYILLVKYVEYDYDTHWHDHRDGAFEVTIHCKR